MSVLLFNQKTVRRKRVLNYYDRKKYREMILDAAETVLGYLALIGLFMERRGRIGIGKGNGMMNFMKTG
jgi:hypothetical protein